MDINDKLNNNNNLGRFISSGLLKTPVRSKCDYCDKKITLIRPRQKYCKKCNAIRGTIAKEKDRERYLKVAREAQKKLRRERRIICLKYYGGDSPICKCCGENNIEFLCIDHIGGGGKKHRDSINNTERHINGWLIKNNFPKGFRVLCHNCNMSLGFYGYCPHDKTKQMQINFSRKAI